MRLIKVVLVPSRRSISQKTNATVQTMTMTNVRKVRRLWSK